MPAFSWWFRLKPYKIMNLIFLSQPQATQLVLCSVVYSENTAIGAEHLVMCATMFALEIVPPLPPPILS